MESEDLESASTADLMRELLERFAESNGLEFVDTTTLALTTHHIMRELNDRKGGAA